MVLSPSQENARVGNRTICLDLRPGAWSFWPVVCWKHQCQRRNPWARAKCDTGGQLSDLVSCSSQAGGTQSIYKITARRAKVSIKLCWSIFKGSVSRENQKDWGLTYCRGFFSPKMNKSQMPLQGSTLDLFISPMVYLPARRLFQFLIQGAGARSSLEGEGLSWCFGWFRLYFGWCP